MKKTKTNRKIHSVPSSEFQVPSSELRTGFTLIELLIVISIIVLLTTIGVGVGYKFAQAANIEQTKANIAIIMNGVERYYDEQGEWPGDQPTALTAGRYAYTDFLHRNLFGVTWDDNNDPDPEKCTFTPTSIGKTSLNKLDAECVAVRHVPYADYSEKERAIWAFSDAFEKVMLYSPYGALGGRPLLISAGRDGLFGPDITYYFDDSGYKWSEDSDDDDTADDNIRSDK